jgi:hypothetical protein
MEGPIPTPVLTGSGSWGLCSAILRRLDFYDRSPPPGCSERATQSVAQMPNPTEKTSNSAIPISRPLGLLIEPDLDLRT